MCAPGDTCDFETGSGLQGSDLTDEQKQLLLDVIANWVGLADEETTATALAEIEATLDDTYINWSGETTYDMSTGDGISFDISGPDAYVAFQAQQGSAGADVDGATTSGGPRPHHLPRPEQRLRRQRDPAGGQRFHGRARRRRTPPGDS